MFDGRGALEMDGDHLDISFNEEQGWQAHTPTGSIKAAFLMLGDPDAGPSLSLARITPHPGENLDWKNTIDPVHHHGSDQFRLIVGGRWVVANRPLDPAGFAFQEAGRFYQEHPGDSEHSWMVLVYGDRRGEPATFANQDKADELAGDDDLLGAALAKPDEVYPHPAGPKGIPAIATSTGTGNRGLTSSSFAEADTWPRTALGTALACGVWGDVEAGPVVYLSKGGPGEVVLPACSVATEVLLTVVEGSCRVGDQDYAEGAMRVQRADAPLGPITAGPGGVSLSVLVADRRAAVTLVEPEAVDAQAWLADTERILEDLRAELTPA